MSSLSITAFAWKETPPRPLPSLAAKATAVRRPAAGPGRSDGLTSTQQRAMTTAVVAIHIAALYGLMQVREFREATRELAPMFVDLIASPAPKPVEVPLPTPVQPVVKRPQPVPLIAAAPSPAPSSFTVQAMPVEPVAAPSPPAAALVVPAAASATAPVRQPKVIAASDVQYLEPPAPVYPRLAARNRETGRVLVLVLIGEDGAPHQVQLAQSSGFGRLDESALAAVRAARFKPPTENGRPVSGWTNVPIDFDLEK